jgi:hypothetical protein
MGKRAWYALLLLPFIGTLLPQLYNRIDPQLFGLPFYYWYQLAWVLVTSLLLGIVVIATRNSNDV